MLPVKGINTKTVARSSCLHNEVSYMGKMSLLYQNDSKWFPMSHHVGNFLFCLKLSQIATNVINAITPRHVCIESVWYWLMLCYHGVCNCHARDLLHFSEFIMTSVKSDYFMRLSNQICVLLSCFHLCTLHLTPCVKCCLLWWSMGPNWT